VSGKLLSGRRVLVVEDEMLVRMMTEDMLTQLGCESVKYAASIDQGLALIDAEVFDLALLDMNLSGSKSFPVADALIARGVAFAFSTGYSGEDMRDGYRDRPVLRKPYRYEELAGVLARLLSG
jgi:CheY-like chemotaxis protein